MFDAAQIPNLLEQVERLRLDAGRATTAEHKATLGQFFTPVPVARKMAALFECSADHISLLDAGAGVGSLFAACVAWFCHAKRRPQRIEVTAYEVDFDLLPFLHQTIALCRAQCEAVGIEFAAQVRTCDFIQSAAEMLSGGLFSSEATPCFNCAVLNPPYRKIHSRSQHRLWLREIGIETSNLYTGFLAAAIRLLQPCGEMVAITPRSFCNGPYFKPFRRTLLQTTALRRLHVYESREQAFRDDKILQENIIFHTVKDDMPPAEVIISSSDSPSDETETVRRVPYCAVVSPNDPQSFIHLVPNPNGEQIAKRMAQLPCSLQDLGVTVSTGRVVDFRAREWLRFQPEPGTAPLIYPTHLRAASVTWPVGRTRKPCALLISDETSPQLIPNAHYVLVKRFSTKEETKRIVATVYEAGSVPGPEIGFENHLNYFHNQGQGLDLTLARGLGLFLNSSLVDAYFRQFNGHTQVNATDLRSLRYPTARQLQDLGEKVGTSRLSQAEIDTLLEGELYAPKD